MPSSRKGKTPESEKRNVYDSMDMKEKDSEKEMRSVEDMDDDIIRMYEEQYGDGLMDLLEEEGLGDIVRDLNHIEDVLDGKKATKRRNLEDVDEDDLHALGIIPSKKVSISKSSKVSKKQKTSEKKDISKEDENSYEYEYSYEDSREEEEEAKKETKVDKGPKSSKKQKKSGDLRIIGEDKKPKSKK
ncbi:hypothetical protein ADUPG1_009249 [Aduncisulcus paluster]|uniref:Uncharacterized protein n=1 Tax=Aduncisulcus paluster TaxID=2918883 RepID=A0ABQ5KUV6_9EUKA|nr:hypothetical protein ADUPG1_009249 [Aduncisulcus paluster]